MDKAILYIYIKQPFKQEIYELLHACWQLAVGTVFKMTFRLYIRHQLQRIKIRRPAGPSFSVKTHFISVTVSMTNFLMQQPAL